MPRKRLIVAALPAAVALLSVSWSAMAAAGSQVHQVAQTRASLIPAALSGPVLGTAGKVASAPAAVPNVPVVGARTAAAPAGKASGARQAALLGHVCSLAKQAPGNAPGAISIQGTAATGDGDNAPQLDVIGMGASTDGTYITSYIKVDNLDPFGQGSVAILPDTPGDMQWIFLWGNEKGGHYLMAHAFGSNIAAADLGVLIPATPATSSKYISTAQYAQFSYGDLTISQDATGKPNGYFFINPHNATGQFDLATNTVQVTAPLAPMGMNKASVLPKPVATTKQMWVNTPLLTVGVQNASELDSKNDFRLGTTC